MAYGTLKDYLERLGLFPTYKAPKYLGKDIEFAYFEFRIPHLIELQEYHDKNGVLPDGWMLDMIELPVHTGIELTMTDDTFRYFKCKVPLCLMKSPMGVGYFAPNMKFNNEMAPPTPDHLIAIDKAFEKAKQQDDTDAKQWELTLRCNKADEDGNLCGREITEIHDTPTGGMVGRYCGKCQSTRLQLVGLKPVKI